MKLLKQINLFWLLIVSMPVFLYVLLTVRYLPQVMFLTITTFAISYVSLALWHHHIDKTLTVEIFLEYVLTAVLAVVVLQGFII